MKMLALLLLLNSQSGDIEGYNIVGIVENVAVCNTANAEVLAKLGTVPAQYVVDALCLDVSKVDLPGLIQRNLKQPPMVSHF